MTDATQPDTEIPEFKGFDPRPVDPKSDPRDSIPPVQFDSQDDSAKASPPHFKPFHSEAIQPAGFERETKSAADEEKTASRADDSRQAEQKDAPPVVQSWITPFLVALVALFASLGGNAYLGWVFWGTRSRYTELVAESRAK